MRSLTSLVQRRQLAAVGGHGEVAVEAELVREQRVEDRRRGEDRQARRGRLVDDLVRGVAARRRGPAARVCVFPASIRRARSTSWSRSSCCSVCGSRTPS